MNPGTKKPTATPTVIGLGLIALVSGLLAAGLVSLWTSHLENRQAEYFRGQGELQARRLQTSLEDLMVEFIETHSGAPRPESWIHEFPAFFARRVPALRERAAISYGDELSLFEIDPSLSPTPRARTIGQRLALYPEPEGTGIGEIDVAVDVREDITRVVVWGPVRVSADVPPSFAAKEFRFRSRLDYPSFRGLTRDGRTYAITLVTIYWLILWVIVFVVYWLGRRQRTIEARSEERSIRLGAMGSVAEGIAHEVRNPLNAIALNVQYLERMQAVGREAENDDFRRVHGEVERIRRVIDDFVNFSKLPEIEPTEWDMGEVVASILADSEGLQDDLGVATTLENLGGDQRVFCDEKRVGQAFRNIFRNGLEAAAEGEDATLRVTLRGVKTGVVVQIMNSGAVVDPETVKAMFDPFFTTRSSAMGLGLTLAKTIIESHGGRISAETRETGGIAIEFWLPRRFSG